MEKLSKTQKEAIQKMGQSRLIVKLRGVGISEEEVDAMDRAEMLEAWAECVATGKDKPAVAPTLAYDVELERQKLDFEIRRFESQERAECAKLEAEKQAKILLLDAEEQARVREDRIRQQDFDNAKKLKRMELESQEKIKDAELVVLSQKYQSETKEHDSTVFRVKRYGDAIKTSLYSMGQDVMEIVSFFRHVESIYKRYEVPTELQADLLQPYLNAKSRSIVGRMDPLLSKDYVQVRNIILKEHKLTPATYLEHFNSTVFAEGETCVMFGARLKALFDQYVESRGVNKDYECLVSLIISDRIKSTLNDGTLRHVLSVESGKKEGWLHANDLADSVDIYTANHFVNDKPRVSAVGSYSLRNNNQRGNQPVKYDQQPPRFVPPRPYTGQPANGPPKTSNVFPPRCYECNQQGHRRKDCPRNRSTFNSRVNACSASTPARTLQLQASQQVSLPQPLKSVPAVVSINETACKQPLTISECTAVSIELDSLHHDLGIKGNIVENTMQDTVDCHYVNTYDSYRDFASLQFVDVCIDEPNVSIECIKALEDSGTELCVIKSAIVEAANLPQVGCVRIRGIVGDPVDAKLVKLHISLAGNSMQSIPIVCAVCPKLNEDLILTVPVVKQLRSVLNTADVLQAAVYDNTVECTVDVAVADSQQQQPPIVIEDNVQTRSADVDILRAEQLSDDSLKPCWAMATQDKGGFFVKDGLLYHQEKVEIIGEK